jgi:hypothetical protein
MFIATVAATEQLCGKAAEVLIEHVCAAATLDVTASSAHANESLRNIG